MKELKEVAIYTDGGCIGNPGPGGYGVILQYNDYEKRISGGFRLTTNNRMEIMAAIVGLEALKFPCSVTLYSDSQYLVESMNEGWVRRWKANNWYRNKKEMAVNTDLWNKLLDLCNRHSVKFVWIKGHEGHQWNEECDALSKKASSQQNLSVDKEYEKQKNQQDQLFVKEDLL
jgi:ribonuclease HI